MLCTLPFCMEALHTLLFGSRLQDKILDGLQYSQFCCHLKWWRESGELRMHRKHKAGDEIFVDYAGRKLSCFVHGNDELRPAEVFVAVLGSSELTNVEASESQEKEQWLRPNERALWYMGGCLGTIVADNLCSAVKRSDPYNHKINPEFAEYYGTVILPARVCTPGFVEEIDFSLARNLDTHQLLRRFQDPLLLLLEVVQGLKLAQLNWV